MVTKRPVTLKNKIIKDHHPLPSEHFKYASFVLSDIFNQDQSIVDQYENVLAEIYNDDLNWSYVWEDSFKGIKNIKRL